MKYRKEKSELKIEPMTSLWVEPYIEHRKRIRKESGRDGSVIFSPTTEDDEEFEKGPDPIPIQKQNQTPINKCGWARSFILRDDQNVYGEVRLVHAPPIASTLHRALVMMGIERKFCGKGYGGRLLKTAIDFARDEAKLEWLTLFVFEPNAPARALYKKFGFTECGTTLDMFRVRGQSISDITMVLNLKTSPGLK